MSSKLQKIKCVVVGDGAVGKTCLLFQYIEDKFYDEYQPTVIALDVQHKLLTVDGKTCNLELWDTAGQEEYDQLRSSCYDDTDVFLVCFSLVYRASLNNVRRKWYPELQHFCPNVPIILVGNKLDLKDNPISLNRGMAVIPSEECLAMYSEIHAESYMECSALTRKNLKQVFDEACRVAMKNKIKKKRTCIIL